MNRRQENIEEASKPAENQSGGIDAKAQEGETFDDIKKRLAAEKKEKAEAAGASK